MIGIDSHGLPKPCGNRTVTMTMLATLSSGPSDRSTPPLMTPGAVAIETSANGASVASVNGIELG